ncbi:MAG: flagellar export protein FliJ [Pirellulales bacterium]
MQPFKFRLATLLRLRSNERDERRAELGKAYEAAAILKERQKEIEGEQADLRRQQGELIGPGQASVEKILHIQRYMLILRVNLTQLAQQQAQVEAEIERRRLVLVEADRQVRILEKLSEKKLSEYQAEELRQEIRDLDEQALQGFERQTEGVVP